MCMFKGQQMRTAWPQARNAKREIKAYLFLKKIQKTMKSRFRRKNTGNVSPKHASTGCFVGSMYGLKALVAIKMARNKLIVESVKVKKWLMNFICCWPQTVFSFLLP